MYALESVLALLVAGTVLDVLDEEERSQRIRLGMLMGLGVLSKHPFGVVVAMLVMRVSLSGRARRLGSRGAAVAVEIGPLMELPGVVMGIAASGVDCLLLAYEPCRPVAVAACRLGERLACGCARR